MPKISGLFSALDISASGLMAQRRRLNAISENLANVNTTRTAEGGPYRRKIASMAELVKQAKTLRQSPMPDKVVDVAKTTRGHMSGAERDLVPEGYSGVQTEIHTDRSDPIAVYDPEHPDADENGYVLMPNINPVREMVDMISATRAYEANISAIKAFKEMAKKALEI